MFVKNCRRSRHRLHRCLHHCLHHRLHHSLHRCLHHRLLCRLHRCLHHRLHRRHCRLHLSRLHLSRLHLSRLIVVLIVDEASKTILLMLNFCHVLLQSGSFIPCYGKDSYQFLRSTISISHPPVNLISTQLLAALFRPDSINWSRLVSGS